MPYYGDGLPYYYGGAFANHSSLMTGTGRIHTPLSRYSPHLSTITESPLTSLRRYSPVTVPARPKRVIDTADIDVSTPRILSHEGSRQRNRLRRDRPTIKIRSQALKDNPALREHNERHEKSVGELLVEKFLIKDKKLDEAERQLRVFHQVSLDRDKEPDSQVVQSKITRRFTRRRSSADIQLDPEQLEREVAYAQVQAEVLDNLVAEEQAEIENEVRRGTLIRKGTIGGPRTVPSFFRGLDRDSASQEEDEASALKMKKTLKKVKKKKKSTDKPSPPTDDESVQESRRSSTSSDVSIELRKNDLSVDLSEETSAKPQMYKIEASNSVGDFSTVWVNTSSSDEHKINIEQFRESIRIPVPRKLTETDKKETIKDITDEIETEVVLPARKPYVKDTSRNSVYFTVKAPQDVLRVDNKTKDTAKPASAETLANGLNSVFESATPGDTEATSNCDFVLPRKKTAPLATSDAIRPRLSENKQKKNDSDDRIIAEPSKPNEAESSLSREENDAISSVSTQRRNVDETKPIATEKKRDLPSAKKVGVVTSALHVDSASNQSKIAPQDDVRPIASDTCERSASAVALPPSAELLPKPSKINTDENNAVEAPELSLREAAYLAKPAKSERDENVKAPLPGKTVSKTATLPKTSAARAIGEPEHVEASKSEKAEDSTRSKVTEIGGATSAAKQTTLSKGPKIESPKIAEDTKKTVASAKGAKTEDAKSAEVTRDPDLPKSTKVEAGKAGGEQPKFSFKAAGPSIPSKVEAEKGPDVEDPKSSSKVMNSLKPLKTEGGKTIVPDVEKQTSKDLPVVPKIENEKVNGVEAKFPWKSKVLPKTTPTNLKGGDTAEPPQSPKDSVAPKAPNLIGTNNLNATSKLSNAPKVLNKSISVEPQKPLLKDPFSKAFKQSSSVDEAQLTKKLPLDKKQASATPLNKNQKENSKSSLDSSEQIAEGTLSKSTSSESIDFWSEIKAPESPKVSRPKPPFNFDRPKPSETPSSPLADAEQPKAPASESASGKSSSTAIKHDDDKKKETDLKISLPLGSPGAELSNVPVIGESPKSKTEEKTPTSEVPATPTEGPDKLEDSLAEKKELRKKKNLVLSITPSKETHSTVKKTPFKREDSSASTISASSLTSTPDTSVPASEVSTPIAEVPLPIINIVKAPTLARADSQNQEDENEDPATPTNEPAESGLGKISKWSNQNDLSNVEDAEKDATPVPSTNTSVTSTPVDSPKSSNKKKVVKKKKSSTTKKSPPKKSSQKAEKEAKESRKDSSRTLEPATLKPPDRKSSPRNSPGQRPMDLIKMFYTTPSALLTATPRDLSKVRRAKIKRRKHQSRPASMNSDSTGSTTSTATTESTDGSGSTCTELDDDPEHKRMNSTRSNDSGFDGSPRISNCDMACHKKCEKLTGNLCGLNQKLVAEALQALKRAPSQSSDNQRNSDSSDHFPSGRITPPATNLPRFKKYCVTDFNFLKVLGKGSFGKVLLAELRGTECVYAVKCLKKDVVLEDDDVECTLIERKVLTLATRHPYLCHLFCTFQTESHLFFVMEYLNGGDLMFHIQKSGRFAESRARFYAAEIWSGLNFLHKKGIVYRDLKLDNVLLDFEGHIRIADFGMCKLQIFLDRTADTFCGTPDYMAPEIIKGLKYNQAVDWWSYGVLLYEMLTGQSPFSGCDEDELFWSICNERPFIPRYLSQEATDVLVCLLEKDSGKRLPGHEIAMHPFFQNLPWDRLERRQMEAPFKPALDHTLDTKYFDTAFTAERPRLTAVPDQILTSMDQGVFRGFSYTNPNATD